MTEPLLPATAQDDVSTAVSRARAELRSARETLAEVTGGASSSHVLAELARGLATELAQQFDELPMHQFTGLVQRSSGLLARLLPRLRIAHRVLLARYVTSTIPVRVGGGFTSRYATIAVIALGADGELRCAITKEFVHIQEKRDVDLEPMDWDDLRVRRVPSRSLAMRRWDGGPEPEQVTTPTRVIGALTSLVHSLAAQASLDLALLKRLL